MATDPGDAFARPPSFMGVPFSRDLSASRAAIIGIPFDCGTHPVRIGSRLGPAAIREQSALVRRYEPPHDDFDPITTLGLVDCGDAAVTPGAVLESYETIEAAIGHIVPAGAVPVALGGDGAISLPHMRALHRRTPIWSCCTSTRTPTPIPARAPPSATATTPPPPSAAPPKKAWSIFRIPIMSARAARPIMDGVFEFTRQKGYRLIPGEDLFARGFSDVLAELHARLAGKPVYLCFDMDFFDPSCAPGVCTPTWGGASAREGLALIKALAGLRLSASRSTPSARRTMSAA